MEMKIRLATVQDAAMFVTKMENIAGDADLKLGSRTVDAKSLIGVCSSAWVRRPFWIFTVIRKVSG